MFKFTLLSLILATTCFAMGKTNTEAQIIEYDEDGYEDEEAPVWVGPGWYWGVYINNENDYNNHYNQRYQNQGDNRGRQNWNGREGGGERGGGGRGGGGHR